MLNVVAKEAGDLQTGIASSVAVGDVNGDGIPDLLVGLPLANGPDGSRPGAGELDVIFGRRDLGGRIELGKDKPDLVIYGARPGDNLGYSVATGDLNGDGIQDIIVGAPGSNTLKNIRTNLGEVYVVFGRKDLGGTVDALKEQQDFTLQAAEGFARLGTSVAAGDVNGDGIADLVAGAPFAGREPGTPPGGPRTTVGEVYVVFGRRDLKGTVSVAEDQQDLILSGLRSQDRFGQSVALADVNGDGIADIITGAPGYSGPDGKRDAAGAVFTYFGSKSIKGKLGVKDAGFTMLGARAGDGLGQIVAGADFNGDGLGDIAAAAPGGAGPSGSRPGSGEARVVFGSRTLGGQLDLAATPPDATVYGPAGALMPVGMAAADVDGDGRADLVLGAPMASANGRALSGVAYIVSGKALHGVKDLVSDTAMTATINGGSANDALGTGVAIGDVNGDGHPEVVLVAAEDQDRSGGPRPPQIYALSLASPQ